ncbi:TMEM175 family protein [Microbacterium sp. SORGH_AS_0888]|uniref:TMEM175 family protein n=1 Tax=Microbacterium sp. SORGH_AS_0888 TaxID=3041791 RepID=UPI00278880D1|nr:TMEM175 family protein [Microbacterium sp. SORGH_AS_0888]MDQ1128144.1 putative membrane protein [Microbacterium sp. SORGH_AS_0888]
MSAMRTERGLDRLVNFSDATVAIAITLLILPLVDDAAAATREGILPWLADNAWEFVAFGLSFLLIARFWAAHHRTFESVATYDARLVQVNFVWLAAIVVMPFNTNLLAATANAQPTAYALYIGNLMAVSLSMQLMERHLSRVPELVSGEVPLQRDLLNGWVTLGLMAAALALAATVPIVGMWWLLLLVLTRPLVLLIRRRGRSASV